MGIYEYFCNLCNNNFDLFVVKFGDVPINPVCPHCGQRDTKRVWKSPPVVRYKGKGFYTTDSKDGDNLDV